MSIVRIRKEEENYILYFPGERLTTVVNEVGAEISDMYLNKDMSIEEIVSQLVTKYEGINKDDLKADVIAFIKDLKKRITISNVNLVEQKQLMYPLGAEVEITSGCNLRCKHCFQGEYKEEFMPFNNFKRIIDILKKNNVFEINLVGGEVFHHEDAMKMINYVAEAGMVLTIVTNATLITDEQIEELSNIKYLYVLISLDGNKTIHEVIRGKGTYERTIETAKKLKNAGINVEFLFTLNAINISVYEEAVEYSKEIDIPINFNLFKPFSKNGHKDLVIEPNKFFAVVENLLSLRVKKGYKIGVSNAAIAAYALGLPDKNECTATLSGLVINKHEKMLACPYLVECGYHKADELPDFDENFLEKWRNGNYFNRFRSNGLRNCQACSYIYSGDVKGFDPYGIDAYKKYQESKEKR